LVTLKLKILEFWGVRIILLSKLFEIQFHSSIIQAQEKKQLIVIRNIYIYV
jgi:hypothetical protein